MVGFKRRKNIKYKYGYCLNTEVVIPSSVRKGFGFYYVSALIAIGFSAAGCFGGGGESKTRYKKTSGITSSNSVATSWQVERSNLNENIETCKRTIEQYASNIAALEEEKRALNEINSMMQEDNFSRSYALSLRHEEEKRALLSQAEVLREELENNQNELYLAVENDLTTLHSSYEEKVNEWESVSSQLVALHEELDSKQNALKLAQEASAVDKKEISKLKSQFEITKSEYEKALSDLDVRAGEIHQLESEIKQAGKELDQARCERDQSNQSLEELQLKLNSSNEINSMMHEDHSHRLNSAYSQLQDALNDKNKQLRLEKLKSWLIHQKISALGVGVAFRRWKEYQLENVLNEKESLLSELQSRGTESGQLVIDLQEVRNALEANKENYTALLNEKQKLQSDFDSLSGDYQLSQEFQSTLANGIADINSGIDGMVAKNEFRIISLESDNQGYYTDTVLKMEALSNENAYLMSELEIVKEEYNQNVLAKQFDIDHLNHVTDQLRNNEQKEHENIISLNAELQKIRDSRKELMDEISDYKKEKDILSENILKLIEDKDSADLQKEHLLSKLQNQLQVLEDEKNNLESNYQQVSHEAVILDNELKEIREQINISESNVEKLHHELEVKEAELNDKNAEILDVKTLFKKRIDELSAELTENKRLTILYTNASSLFMQKINLRRGYDAFKENYYVSRNESLQNRSKQMVQQLESEFNKKIDFIQLEKQNISSELDTIKARIADAEKNEERMQLDSTELTEQLAAKAEELNEKESQLQMLKVEYDESLKKVSERDTEIEQLLTERALLESSLRELDNGKNSEIEGLNTQVKSLSDEISEKNTKIATITGELESEKTLLSEQISKLNIEKEQLEQERDRLSSELESSKLANDNNVDHISNLEKDLAVKSSEIEQIRIEKDTLESSLKFLESGKNSEIENIITQVRSLSDEISEKNNQIDAITSELDSEKTKSHQEITTLNSRLEILNAEKDQLEEEKTKLGLELDTVKEALSDSRDREDRIQIYSAELKEQLASKQEGLREKESELETLKVHHHESLSKLEEKDAEIEQLLSERESLESTLKEIELSKGSEIEALTDNVKRIHEQLSKVSDELSERNASVDAITAELESEKVRFNDELSKLNTDLALLMSGKEQLEKERDELLSDYQDSKAESEDYINQISSLEEHLTTKVSEIESLCDEIKQKDNEYTDKISRIESDKADISSQFDEAKRNVNELESFKNDLEKELAKRSEIFDAEINSLKLGLNEKEELLIQRIHGLKVEKEDYLEKIEKYQLEQKQYKAELQELQELEKKALEDVAKEIHNKELLKNDMQDKMSEIYEKISDLEKELVDKQSSIVDLTTNLTNTSSVAQDRLEELTKVKNDLASAYTEVDNLHSEMDAFKGSTDELGRLNTDLCKQLDTLTNQKMVLEEKINILSAENSDHQSEIESLENKISGLDISLKLKQEELEKLQPFLEELSELKDSYNNIQIEIDSLKSQNGTLENEKDELHSEIQSLEVGKALLESKILGLEVDIQHLQEKEEELAKIQELEEYYKEELNNQYKCIQEAEEKNNNYVKEIDDLNQELSSNHLKYEKLNEDYQIINSELENKNAQITTLSVKDVENKEKIDAIQNEKSKLENSLEDMRKEKDSLVTKIDALYVEKNQIEDRLSEKVIELEQNIEMLILERKRKDVRLSEVNILLEEKDQKLNEYSKHIQQFNNMIDDICKKETQLKADLRQALESDSKNKEVIEDLQENLTDASATIQATKHEHANMQSQFAMIEVEKINLNSELSSINVELRNNKKELDKNIAEVKVLTHALAEEHHKNSLVQQEKIRLEGQVANLEDDLSSLTIKHQMLKNEKENILCEYTILQAQYSSSAEEESRINEALNVSNKELAEYKIQLDEQVELANSYNSMKANAKEGAVTQLDEFDKLKKKKLKLEEYINKAEEDLSRYRLLLASQDSQNTGSQLNRQNGNGNLQIATSEKENLEGTISRLEKKKHQSEIELNKLNEVNANVEGEFNYYLDEMALSSKGLSQLSSKQEGLVLKNDQLTEQLNKIASEKHNLQEKLANSEKRLQENIENSNSIEIENKRLKESLDRAMTAIENHETLKHQSDENVSKLISTPIKFDTLAEEIDDMKRTLSSSLSLRRSSIGLEANKEIGSPEEGIHLLEEKNIELEESERRLSRSIENIHEKLQEVEKDAALLNHIETLKLKASPLKENKIDDSQIVEEKREGDKLDSSFNTEYDNCKKSYTALPDKMLQRALDNVDLNYFSAENLLDQAQKDLKVLSDQKKKVRKSIDTLKELSEGDKENYHASSSLIRSGIVVNAAMTGNAATPGMQTQGLISKAANADQRKNKGRLSDVSFVGSRRESLPLEKVMGSLDSDLNISQIPAKQDINALKNSQMLNDSPAMTIEDIKNLPTKSVDSSMVSDVKEQEAILNQKKAIDTKNALEDAGKVLQESNEVIKSTKVKYDLRPAYADPDYPLMNYLTKYYIARKKIFLENNEKGVLDNDYKPTQDKVDEKFEQIDTHFNNKETYKPFHGKDEGDRKVLLKKLRKHYIKPVDWISESNRKYYKMNYSRINSSDLLKTDALYLTRRDRFFQESKLKDKRRELLLNSNLNMEDFLALKKQLVKILIYNNGSVKYHEFGEKFKGIDLVKNSNDSELLSKQKQVDSFLEILSKFFELDGILNYFQSKSELVIAMYELTTNVHRAVRKIGAETFMPASMLFSNAQNLKTEMIPLVCELINEYKIINDDK